MRTLGRFALASLPLVACKASAPASHPFHEGPPSCDDFRQAALSSVEQVIEAHLTCTTDADCTTVALAADCFDACSRSVNVGGKGDLLAAKERVNGAECHEFEERRCSVVPPPCVAPRLPRCQAGSCI
jgi:hypothetical protein